MVLATLGVPGAGQGSMKFSIRIVMMVEHHVMRFFVAPGTSITPTIGIFAYFGCDTAHAFSVIWLTEEAPGMIFRSSSRRPRCILCTIVVLCW
jgi:hypothetical protein